MKLPYRLGDLFALPLGDGSSVEAQVVACGHHTVYIAAASLAPIRATDRALVLERWRPAERRSVDAEPLAKSVYWRGAAFVERAIATQLGRGVLLAPPLIVRSRSYVPEIPTARSVDALRDLPSDLRALRVAGRALDLPVAELTRFTSLERLDCSGVVLREPERLAELASLRALRVARVNRFDIRAIRDLRVTTLAFESISDLRNIDALLDHRELVQLELLDLWPAGLSEVLPLIGHPSLLRVEIDIGGRRKNVELYRRANWAYPWPFDLQQDA